MQITSMNGTMFLGCSSRSTATRALAHVGDERPRRCGTATGTKPGPCPRRRTSAVGSAGAFELLTRFDTADQVIPK